MAPDSFAETLDQLALLLELSGRGALASRLASAARHDGAATGFRRLDREVDRYLAEARAGRGDRLIEEARRQLPPGVRRFLEAGQIDVRGLARLAREAGAASAGELVLAAAAGWGEDTTDAFALDRAIRMARSPTSRLTLGRALDLLDEAAGVLEASGLERWEPTGSLRRFEPVVGDVKIIGIAGDPAEAAERVAARAGRYAFLRAPNLVAFPMGSHEITVRLTAPEHAGAVLLFHTGSVEHVRALAGRARRFGLRLGPGGFIEASGTPRPAASEADAYAALGLPEIPPELRRGRDELEAAEQGRLPRLVDVADIRGDLHLHTTWSDGRDSLERMVEAARHLGYEYVAITDHSPSTGLGRTVGPSALERQMIEIDRLQARWPSIRILKGAEVDILPDGSLDLPDDLLERLDVVLASLHDPAGQDPDELLARYVRAMEHPCVSIITHPANRMVGYTDGYALDFDALFDAAVRTGTILEVDGAPVHLDLDGDLARRAAAAGVLLAIDSDCHQADRLGRQMRCGVGTARRGWLEPRHVVNTRPWPEVAAILARKRARPAQA
ncbi:MAG TPA: PHP domain-containing protein [Vicinamibacterales bacterium]|nr:PHP domain-containing protein [Vicinamibacterales bacterium]